MGPGCPTNLPPNTLNNDKYYYKCVCISHVFEVISSVLTCINIIYIIMLFILYYIIVFVFATVVEYIFLRPLAKFVILLTCVG
jgi:hypothetical protein